MTKQLVFIIIISFYFSCQTKPKKQIYNSEINLELDDSEYLLNQSYSKGDVRRYGIYPNKKISQVNLKNLIILSSKGLPIVFPEGYYKTNLILDSISNVNFTFNNATITGSINIINNSNKIKLGGNLTVLERLFVRHSRNIFFDTLTVKSDTLNSITNKKNRGVSLYVGSKNISFQYLNIENTGGLEDKFYQHTASALQIHGWNNNPENIYIKNLDIKNVDRTGLYLTGNNNKIEKVIITNFGLGSPKNIYGLGDASPGEEKEFSGVWINRCNDCEIDTLIVNSELNKGSYSLRLDEGKYYNPTFIYNVHFVNKANALPVKDDELTNILVKNEY